MPVTTYLTLKRAAEQLGIHEQTLRAWERKGLIQLAHLPNSGYRRVPMQEVERLQVVMMSKQLEESVVLIPPKRDIQSVAQAQTLADEIETALKAVTSEQTFDEFLESRRGRQWLQ